MSRAELLYTGMARIRAFEEALLAKFRSGEARGTTHTYLGQEAIACSLFSHITANDYVFSNHRCHGHYLAWGGSIRGLLWEIMGLSEGICGGMGGSQHLCDGLFRSNGVQGGIVPVTCGLALGAKLRGDGCIALCMLGDGTLGEGVVYESFNMASLYGLPVLFVIEDNAIAQTTSSAMSLAGVMAERPRAFGIATGETDSNDVMDLDRIFGEAVNLVRTTGRPFCQIVHTHRLGPHSKGDDTRSKAELESCWATDPLRVAARHCDEEFQVRAKESADAEVNALFAEAIARRRTVAQDADRASVVTDDQLIPAIFEPTNGISSGGRTGVEALRATLGRLLDCRSDVLMVGEDILDPYGGAFKATEGLQARYPGRFFTTPISEAGIIGLGGGLALAGFRPVVEIMFGDFLTLGADQLVNHAAKFYGMYNRQAVCPLIVRTPMGGYRGYGPTHSQCTEKLFLGVPGLVVTAASVAHDLDLLWDRMIDLNHPVLHVENKADYGRSLPRREGAKFGPFECESSRSYFPTLRFRLAGQRRPPATIILTYGGMASLALEAMKAAFEEEEIAVEVCVFAQLAPVPEDDVHWAVGATPAFVTLEEGSERSGWGAEICSVIQTERPRRAGRVAALNAIVPASEAGEKAVLPTRERILKAVKKVCREPT